MPTVNEWTAEYTWRRRFGAAEYLDVGKCAYAIQRSKAYAVRILNKLEKLGVVHLAVCENGLPMSYTWGKAPMPPQKRKKSDFVDCSDGARILAKVYGLS